VAAGGRSARGWVLGLVILLALAAGLAVWMRATGNGWQSAGKFLQDRAAKRARRR